MMFHTFGHKGKKTYSNNQILAKKGYCDKRFYCKIVYSSGDMTGTLPLDKINKLPANGKTKKGGNSTQNTEIQNTVSMGRYALDER